MPSVPLDVTVVESLVVALLGVNSYSPARVYDLLPQMRDHRLLDPDWTSTATIGQVTVALTKSGYTRGMLNGIMAERLIALMSAIAAGRMSILASAIAQNDRAAATSLLREVRGIGPRVADIAWLLLTRRHD
jgi:hypothetical protein